MYDAAPALYEFFTRLAGTAVPWIALGKFGFTDAFPEAQIKKFFALYGMNFHGVVTPPLMTKTLIEKTEPLSFERKIRVVDNSPIVAKNDKTVNHWLKTSDINGETVSSQVFTSKKFSLAYDNYGLYTDPKERHVWQVNPFTFFSEALGLDRRMPLPDVAVLNGRRVFFSHIDGDAFVSMSRIDITKYCGEIMESEVIRKYPTLPFGVSLVAAEVAKEGFGNERVVEVAKRVIAHPNVEAASHTFFHPLVWRDGKLSYFAEKNKFDVQRETVGSVEYLRKNIAGDKPVETLYWSGDCAPTEVALKTTTDAGILNMNGGDSRFDSAFNSLSYVSALGRTVGSQYQVYAANANDNVYTNGWEGPYYGFGQVVETFEKTGSPRILKAINPYFHFFSAERKEGIDAIKKAMDWAVQRPIAPIFPSVYVRSVLAWKDAHFKPTGPNRYEIDAGPHLKTLRIDEPKGFLPDLRKSKHVIGYTELQGALYLHLAPFPKTPIVVELFPKASAENNPPYLDSVGGMLLEHESDAKHLKFKLAPFARGPLVVKNLRKHSVTLNAKPVKVEKGVLNWEFASSDKSQEIEITL